MNDPTSAPGNQSNDTASSDARTGSAPFDPGVGSVESALIRLEASDPADAPPIADEIAAVLAGRLEAPTAESEGRDSPEGAERSPTPGGETV